MDTRLRELLQQIDRERLPRHIGVIMDGNGRWAQARGLPRGEGHRQGVQRVRELIPFAARELNLKALTLYVFSLENWQRPPEEIEALMVILEYFLTEELPALLKDNIRFVACGDLTRLPDHIRTLVDDGMRETTHCTGMIVNAALSYGGRNEIVRAVQKLIAAGITSDRVNEKALARCLDTPDLPDPDLIIRTSGECRTSNFLLWQAAYAEYFFTETAWPEFSSAELVQALLDYQQRERRYGALPDASGSAL